MTREEARDILKNKSCVDCVDRCAYPLENQKGYCEYADAISMAIEALKTDVPETNVGKWIPMYNGKLTGGAYWFSCAKCKRVVPDVQNGGWEYCPRCGKRNILNK